jgi:hypothetical protein
MLGVAVELELVIHDHVEVTFKEGGRFGWISCMDLARSFARPTTTIIVVFPVEVMHHRVLSSDKLVDVGHDVGDGVRWLLRVKELDVGYPLLVVDYDVFVLDTCKGVAILKVLVSVLSESFVTAHPHSSEVMCVSRMIVGRLVVGREEL